MIRRSLQLAQPLLASSSTYQLTQPTTSKAHQRQAAPWFRSKHSWKGRICLTALILALGMAHSTRAHAKLFEAWASALTGLADGRGKTDRDFYTWTGGMASGVEVGAKLLFLTGYIDYLRFFQGTGANLISINLGSDGRIGFPLLPIKVVYRIATSGYLGSLGKGTRTLDDGTEIDSENIKTRGVGARAGVGLEYTFLKVMSLGLRPMIGYHYFFGGSADGQDQNGVELSQNSHGIDYQAMLYLRIGLGI